MKLSFSLPPKTKSRSTVRPISGSNVTKEFVTEFDPSETLHSAKPKYVIPPIEERRKDIYLPLQSASGLKFEADIPSGEGHVSDNVTYVLNLRQKVEKNPKPEPVEQLLLKNLRNDLKSLPDDPELEELKSFQVEGFGVALLSGYGWKPGNGIGRKAKEVVQIVEPKNWTCNEEVGFNPDKARVKGTNARDMALKGKIVEKLGSGSQQEVNVEKYTRVSKRSRETEPTEDRACKKNYRGQTIETREKASWLRSHIRVRIISKHVKGGRFYLKKAVVTDVVGPTTCDITMDENQELVQGIDQELLETVLPRRGGPVLVLSGRHKGVYGSLVEKDLDKETGVVCDADSKEMLDVKLEQVAEYMGDPADIGY